MEYKKGCENRVADALSRQFGVDSDLHASSSNSRIGCLMLLTVPDPTWLDGLKASYTLDASVQQLIATVQAGSPPKGFTFQNGLFFYKGRFFVGPSCPLKLQFLHHVHSSPLASHSGFLKSYQRAKSDFYWHGRSLTSRSSLGSATSVKGSSLIHRPLLVYFNHCLFLLLLGLM